MFNDGLSFKRKLCLGVCLLLAAMVVPGDDAMAQAPSTSLQGYGLKIFRVESGLYPFVQVYFRTFDQDMQPLVNLNELNIGVMVDGKPYAMEKKQYFVEAVRGRDEAVRTIFVIDCSKTMAGAPFEKALEAAARYVDAKRPQDQVAIIAVTDATDGYEVASNFENDPGVLGRRMADLEATANTTRLYDAIGAAMQMTGMVGQQGVSSGDATYIGSTSIVVFSDGKDEGSAISRSDLMTRISGLPTPIPIYSLAYTRIDAEHLKNLQALSKNSFGKYYHIDESMDNMTRSMENIQHIQLNDYVVTFRAYIPVDGDEHNLKVGLEYPSRSGNMTYQSAAFEAIMPPSIDKILQAQQRLDQVLVKLPDANPYMTNQFAPTGESTP